MIRYRMALSASTLSAAMRAAIIAKGTTGAQDTVALTDLCDAIAAAVVTHITSSAVVNTLGMFAPPGTAGGPVTGAGTIT